MVVESVGDAEQWGVQGDWAGMPLAIRVLGSRQRNGLATTNGGGRLPKAYSCRPVAATHSGNDLSLRANRAPDRHHNSTLEPPTAEEVAHPSGRWVVVTFGAGKFT